MSTEGISIDFSNEGDGETGTSFDALAAKNKCDNSDGLARSLIGDPLDVGVTLLFASRLSSSCQTVSGLPATAAVSDERGWSPNPRGICDSE